LKSEFCFFTVLDFINSLEPRAKPFPDIGYKGSEIRVGYFGSGGWVLDENPRFLNGPHQPEMCAPNPPLFNTQKNFGNAKLPNSSKKSTSGKIKICSQLKGSFKKSKCLFCGIEVLSKKTFVPPREKLIFVLLQTEMEKGLR
jgi:hypothetical protein